MRSGVAETLIDNLRDEYDEHLANADVSTLPAELRGVLTGEEPAGAPASS